MAHVYYMALASRLAPSCEGIMISYIPAEYDLNKYPYIVLWNRAVAFGTANLKLAEMKEEYAHRLNNWIGRVLERTSLIVKFIKKNGETRFMSCTLQESALPKNHDFHITKLYNPCLMSVWDLDRDAWRSIPIDRIQGIWVHTDNTRVAQWELVKAF